MKKETPMRPVLVDWVDSYGCSSNWQSLKDIEATPFRCRSIGWVAYEDDASIVIVPHITESDHLNGPQQGCGDMTIPRCAIVRILDLSLPD